MGEAKTVIFKIIRFILDAIDGALIMEPKILKVIYIIYISCLKKLALSYITKVSTYILLTVRLVMVALRPPKRVQAIELRLRLVNWSRTLGRKSAILCKSSRRVTTQLSHAA